MRSGTLKNHLKICFLALMVLAFFLFIYQFQDWLILQADYPHDDEHRSLLSALGVDSYFPNLYSFMLSFFAIFLKDYKSLHDFNFIWANFCLSLSFFIYHLRKKISLPTNLFFTGLLALSPLNIIFSRKIHFWSVSFFFVIMTVASFFSGRRRDWFLIISFFVLGIFRYEFLFCAGVALAMQAVTHDLIRNVFLKILVVITIFVMIIGFIVLSRWGMQDLLQEAISLQRPWGRFHVFFQIKEGIVHYFYYVYEFFFHSLKSYFITLVNAFGLLFFMMKPLKENFAHFFKIYKKDFLYYYFPACAALLCINHLYFYGLIFHVLVYSVLAFLINSRENKIFSFVIFSLVSMAFLINRPNFFIKTSNLFYSNRTYLGQLNKFIHSAIERLSKVSEDGSYNVLSYDIIGGTPFQEKIRSYRFLDWEKNCAQKSVRFDMVFLMNLDLEKEKTKKCLFEKNGEFKIVKYNSNVSIYLSKRIDVKWLPRTEQD